MKKHNRINRILVIFLILSLIIATGCSTDKKEINAATDTVTASIINDTKGSIADSDAAKSTEKTTTQQEQLNKENKQSFDPGMVPEYSGEAYAIINSNQPFFTEEDMTTQAFEKYSELDELGRCQEAYANVGKELMPVQPRGNIGSIKPTGWQTVKYDNISGKYLYNRCHLIGYQLTAENANKCNLITGTRYLNIDGMLPFENMTADYIKETNNHVLYRVTPIFEGEDMLARGVLMEAYSVEDDGDGICFCIYAYNVQPGIDIDYKTGESSKK